MRHWHMSAHIPIPGGCLELAECNKPGWRSSSGLSFCPLCFLSLKALALLPPWAPGLEDGARIQAGSGQNWKWAGSPRWLYWWSWLSALLTLLQSSASQSALCLDSLIDLNLHTPRSREISTPRIHHPQPASTSSLSTCLFGEAILVCVSSSFPTWNLFPSSSLLSLHLCSLILSCLSLPRLLRFNKSPEGSERENRRGGVKTSMALFTKGPGIAQR